MKEILPMRASKIQSPEWYKLRLERGDTLGKMAKEIGVGTPGAVRCQLKKLGLYTEKPCEPDSITERFKEALKLVEGGETKVRACELAGITFRAFRKRADDIEYRKNLAARDNVSSLSKTWISRQLIGSAQ
jgi:hypothetical protein